MDGWNQSINQYKNTADRLDVTFKRAVYAMGATSSTTCVAFMATAVSPIMPIASFGIYAALGVFLNYVLVITLFPCVLMIWHYKLYGCCKRMPQPVEKVFNLLTIPACHMRDEATCCCQQPYHLPKAVSNCARAEHLTLLLCHRLLVVWSGYRCAAAAFCLQLTLDLYLCLTMDLLTHVILLCNGLSFFTLPLDNDRVLPTVENKAPQRLRKRLC